ncbi:MAG: amidohydrolase family protein [Ilumatobacteraceae bacterium]
MNAEHAEWIVTGTVITCDAERRVLTDGAVAVAGGRVAAVGTREDVLASWTAPADRWLGGARSTVMPGMIDGHSHAAQALVRSLIAGELPMIHRLYLPAEDVMSLDDVGVSARLLMAQHLRCGVTTFAETTATPSHEEAIVAAIDEVGMRCAMARGRGDQQAHHAANYSQVQDRSWVRRRDGEAEADLARTAAFLDRHDPSGSGRIKGCVLASHLTGFSRRYFELASELARDRAATLQVHVGRDREEVELSLAVFGRRPVEVLAEWGVLSDRLLAIHAILVSVGEIGLLAEAGASVAHSPAECLNILNGVPPVAQMRARGIAVALGCDNAINDLWAVMRMAAGAHGALYGIAGYDAELLPADHLLDMATIEGATALGWADRIGSLEVGKHADVVVVDGSGAHMVPVQHPVADLVRYGSRAEVRDVLVGGRLVLSGGRHTTVDIERLTAEADDAAARIAAAITPRRYRPLAPRIRLS